jgi:hypothetical protein
MLDVDVLVALRLGVGEAVQSGMMVSGEPQKHRVDTQLECSLLNERHVKRFSMLACSYQGRDEKNKEQKGKTARAWWGCSQDRVGTAETRARQATLDVLSVLLFRSRQLKTVAVQLLKCVTPSLVE